jgi:LysR family nitrogen assimilation transcriptional regulator
MNLKQLRYFVRIAELGSLAKAADVLDVGQPTLSRQIRDLEVELKTHLFFRNGRGVQLTPVGSRFLAQAHGVLHAADAALQVLEVAEGSYVGKVVCGLTPSVARMMIPEYVRRFREALPDATLTISNGLSGELQDQLAASQLDFAILHDPEPSLHASATLLAHHRLYLIGNRRLGSSVDTVPLSVLHNLPLIMPSEKHVVRKSVEVAAARAGVTLNVTLEVDVIEPLLELVAQGAGYTIATPVAIRGLRESDGLFVQELTNPTVSSNLYLLTPLQRTLTPLQDRAAQIAREAFAALTGATPALQPPQATGPAPAPTAG